MTLTFPHPRRLLVLAAALAIVTGILALIVGRAEQPPAPATGSAPAAVRPGTSTAARISALQRAVREAPASAPAATALAQAYLQRARETADPSWYAKADGLLRRARRLAPRDPAVLTAAGALALARHDFRGARRDGEAARHGSTRPHASRGGARRREHRARAL